MGSITFRLLFSGLAAAVVVSGLAAAPPIAMIRAAMAQPAPSCPAFASYELRLAPLAATPGGGARRAPTRAEPLAPFADALAQLTAGRAREPVTVLMLGDSHTAAQFLANRLRELLAGYGSAGPGAMPPSPAQPAYRNARVELSHAGRWSTVNARRAGTPGPFGLSGYRLRAEAPGASFTARMREDAGVDRLEIVFLRGTGAGLRLTVNGCAVGPIATAGPVQPARLLASLPPGTSEVTVEALDAGIEILGWRLWRRDGGTLVENHGVNGALISMLGHLDPDIVAGELRGRDPALIVVAFGTNEAFATDLSEDAYRQLAIERLSALRAMAPRAAILVVGPPDVGVRVGSGRPVAGAPCGWRAPGNLEMVKRVLRQVAGEIGLSYWDWSTLTGGACGVDAMTRTQPPLARPDHVHFTREGYVVAADALFQHVMDQVRRIRR